MMGEKSAYLCALLCVLFTSSIFVSEVNARKISKSRSYSSHGSQSYQSSFQSGRGSVVHQSYSPSHTYPSNSGRASSSSAHNYPSSAVHSLSGNTGSSSGHSYTPSRLSGSGSKPGSASYPSTNFGSISGSAAHGYPNSRPNSLSGGASGSSVQGYPSLNVQSSFGTQLGSAQYNNVNSGSAVHSYPNSRPNSLSGGGSGSSGHSYPPTNTWSGSGSRPGSSYPQNTHNTNTYPSTSWGSNTQVHHHHHYVYKPPTVIHYGYGAHYNSYPVYTGVPPPYVYEYRSSGNKYSHLLAGLALYNLGRISASSSSHNYHRHYIPTPNEYCKFGVQYRTGTFEEMGIDCRSITFFIYEDQLQVQSHLTSNIINQQINSMTLTSTQVMSVTDPRFTGRPVQVIPDMECYVTRTTSFNNMKKTVPCELLQKYSASSLYNSGGMIKLSLTAILVAFAVALY